jgi:hypothetical protein
LSKRRCIGQEEADGSDKKGKAGIWRQVVCWTQEGRLAASQ